VATRHENRCGGVSKLGSGLAVAPDMSQIVMARENIDEQTAIPSLEDCVGRMSAFDHFIHNVVLSLHFVANPPYAAASRQSLSLVISRLDTMTSP
jgi:hypothetical protein